MRKFGHWNPCTFGGLIKIVYHLKNECHEKQMEKSQYRTNDPCSFA